MGFIDRVKKLISRLFGKKTWKIGLYGAPNAGKTTLANRITMDWSDMAMGLTSPIPHETKEVRHREVVINTGRSKASFRIYDTPGVATEIDFYNFVEKYGLDEKEGKRRAKEGTKGVIEAIKWLDAMDGILLIMDATEDPFNQVNITLLGNCKARSLPVMIVANKIDLKKASADKIKAGFDEDVVVSVSALKGQNMEAFYERMIKHFT